MAGVSLLLTMHTMDVYGVWSGDIFSLLMLLPCLLAFALLGGQLAFRASRRSRLALATTTAILTVATFGAYLPELANGPGGCMSGLIVIPSMGFSIGFPVILGISWLLFGLGPKA